MLLNNRGDSLLFLIVLVGSTLPLGLSISVQTRVPLSPSIIVRYWLMSDDPLWRSERYAWALRNVTAAYRLMDGRFVGRHQASRI